MSCPKCGAEMEPTGEMMTPLFPFFGCPKCGSEETKEKIRSCAAFMKKQYAKRQEMNEEIKKK